MFKKWDEILRYTITVGGMLIFVATVLFAFTGNWEHIKTFGYWFDTIGSTSFAFFLRYLWQPKGEFTALETDVEVKEKESAKGQLILDITVNKLTDKLKVRAEKKTKENKLTAWYDLCMEKVEYYKNIKFLPFKKTLLNKWEERLKLVQEYKLCEDKDNYQGEFNLNNVKVEHYIYDIDMLLTSSYRQSLRGKRTRYNRNKTLRRSFRINLITFITMAVFSGMQVLLVEAKTEDLIVLGGKIGMFFINIRNGYLLGVEGITDEYSADLTDDILFMRKFLNEELIK